VRAVVEKKRGNTDSFAPGGVSVVIVACHGAKKEKKSSHLLKRRQLEKGAKIHGPGKKTIYRWLTTNEEQFGSGLWGRELHVLPFREESPPMAAKKKVGDD